MRSKARKAVARLSGVSVEESPGYQQRVTIDSLTDNVLLEIFKVYIDEYKSHSYGWEERLAHGAWRTLVHVCHRWRCVVFDSPRRLDLNLLYTSKGSVAKMLGIWPALPIAIMASILMTAFGSQDTDSSNVITALEQHNRVSKICLLFVPNVLSRAVLAMNKSFPSLTDLILYSYPARGIPEPPTLPDSFLGGFSPRLRHIDLQGIPFPGIGKLISSTTGLVELHLCDIPETGYITPEAMATSLTALTNLKSFSLRFRCSRPWNDRASSHPPLPTPVRAILPALTTINFLGDSGYLEVILSRIDTPLLDHASLDFFRQSISDTPLLRDFISRVATSKLPQQVNVDFQNSGIGLWLFRKNGADYHMVLILIISYLHREFQLSPVLLFHGSVLPPLPTLERLKLRVSPGNGTFNVGVIENIRWREFFHPFASVKDLAVASMQLARPISSALAELAGKGVMEVLPMLQNIFLKWQGPSGTFQEAMDQFIATRRLSGCPVAVHKGRNVGS